MLQENIMKHKITGMMIYYYFVCKRKLWYFSHEIQMEQENELIEIGKVIDETTYSRENKHINIDNTINIDFIKNKSIIHEVKKSKKIEEANIWQVKYYLYYLYKKGVYGVKGIIDYPLLKERVEVCLEEADIIKLDDIINEINGILERKIPVLEKQSICKNCAYHDLCFI